MPVSRTEIERAIDYLKTDKQNVIRLWLREQGVKFSERQFRKLHREVVESKVEYKGVRTRTKVQNQPEELPENELPLFGGRIYTPDAFRRKLPGKRFFCTVAQNNTKLHDAAWKTLQKFISETGTTLLISKCSYNKNGWQKVTAESEGLWYDERIEPYTLDEQVKLAEDLVFCAELDILPTAAWPLNGLDNYTGHNSAIIPHAKMQMRSLATMKDHPAKLLYSTGTLTLRNYIQRRVGQIAEYHHIFGGMLVEIDDEGDWFARQINFNDDGSFTDLNVHWTADGPKLPGAPIINLADLHVEKMDPVAWRGAQKFLKDMQASIVVCHDTLDFESRNHHNKRDPYFVAEMEFSGRNRVADNIMDAARVMRSISDILPDAVVLNIRSNHDQALLRWLREGSTFTDPINARYWHELNAAIYKAIEERDVSFDIYEYAMSRTGVDLSNIVFVREDESAVFNGIEFGMHGHLGANGSRGSPKTYRQLGRRANTGHTHSAGIVDGVWTAGAMALDMGYNTGLSSWSVSHILTHSTGKRQIVTQRGEKYRA